MQPRRDLAWLDDPRAARTVQRRPYSMSRHMLRIARFLWRAEDRTATEYFLETITLAQNGFAIQGDQLQCYLDVFFCQLFLDDITAADAALQAAFSVYVADGFDLNENEFLQSLPLVVRALSTGTATVYAAAYSQLTDRFARVQISSLMAEAPPIVDVYELLVRKQHAVIT